MPGRIVVVSGLIFWAWLFSGCSHPQSAYEDHFAEGVKRTWIGPHYWANRLQDWQLANGRLECLEAAANRNVNLLTARISEEEGDFSFSVHLGVSEVPGLKDAANWLGFRLGINGEFNDYRDDAIYGKGLDVGITTTGKLFIGTLSSGDNRKDALSLGAGNDLVLELQVEHGGDQCILTLIAIHDGKELARVSKQIEADRLVGAMALVSHFPEVDEQTPGSVSWFDDLEIRGNKIALFPDRAFGPILFTQYTLSRGIMKMTAQLPPVGPGDGREVALQIKNAGGWQTIREQVIEPMSRTATFRITKWEYQNDIPYRLVYHLNEGSDKLTPYYWQGVVRKEPLQKEEVVVAGFTGNNDLGFPNIDLVKAVTYHNPDMLFFSGDQIYERVAGFGVQRQPLAKATLDYLRKWYIFGWAYGDLMRDRPTITIPDDHDVYHGNIWGAAGKATPAGLTGVAAQDEGGYKMPAAWVNMVQRAQTSHLPDPVDPQPVLQGIGVYFTEFNYGGISFAVLEDRKFKSAPKPLLPDAQINNGWFQNRDWDPVTGGDMPEAKLLGERQLRFLEEWAADWSNHTWMKVVLSQTIFANVATLPAGEYHDNIVPKLRILNAGEYPEDDQPVADMDSNGWPQTGRNKAVKTMRKAFALHLAGDQHLGSVIQYGVDDWHDAGYAFCVPAISNIWPRRWFPSTPGRNRPAKAPPYAGDFYDGFGNKMTVLAVSNPVFTGKAPSKLYDRATGYGIVRFNRKSRRITLECWPRYVNPKENPLGQYPGWPITVNQTDQYNKAAFGWLPRLQITGMTDAVVRVYREDDNRLVYALRIQGNIFDPRVFAPGLYRLEIGNPDLDKWQVFPGLQPAAARNQTGLAVQF